MDIAAAQASPTSPALEAADRRAIDALAAAFFAAFSNVDGRPVDLSVLRALCLPHARMVKAVGSHPESCDIAGFIAPRDALLNGGRLRRFAEREVEARTDLFGNIAQRWCRYHKAGVLDGVAFEAEGWKSLQCVRTPSGWRIAGVAWDDA